MRLLGLDLMSGRGGGSPLIPYWLINEQCFLVYHLKKNWLSFFFFLKSRKEMVFWFVCFWSYKLGYKGELWVCRLHWCDALF